MIDVIRLRSNASSLEEGGWLGKIGPFHRAPEAKPPARVYHEHVAILREINAPERIIEIAERVVVANSSSSGKK